MKLKLTLCTFLCALLSATTFAQSATKNASHIGTWKLISQKVTYPDGQIFTGDSSTVFQRKILTPATFVVVIEKKMANYDNKKLATSVAGGHYTLVNGNYEELTEYASFKGFETMKVNYKLSIEDGKLHTVGTVGENIIYDELYIKED
ncbi:MULTISPECIES: hypothetical protein [Pedobacter]|uniref:hypothetical protein n=1 Tax=Pedobacter TaxID=84567 RepID=UPI0021098FDF|nr:MULTISPECIES: hypothetical protein [unclassified Pedobacter]